MYHILKLFQTGASSSDIGNEPNKGLVSESYDEIVFQEPTQLMQHLLTNTKQVTLGPWKHDTDFEEKKDRTLNTVVGAKNKIRTEIVTLKDRLKLAKETISKFKSEIAKLQANQYPGFSSV